MFDLHTYIVTSIYTESPGFSLSQSSKFHCDTDTVETDLIATEMLAFPSKPSRNKNDSNLTIAIP